MPKAKDENKVIAIHEAALKLVIKTGFGGLKMADVAIEAKVATGTLYVYYKSKDELINALFLVLKKEIVETLLDSENNGETFFITYKKMWLSYFKFCFKSPEKMMFVEQFLHSGVILPVNIQLSEQWMEPLYVMLKEVQNQGIIKNIDVHILKAQMQGSLHEVVKLLIQTKQQPNQILIDSCFDMAWDSIKR